MLHPFLRFRISRCDLFRRQFLGDGIRKRKIRKSKCDIAIAVAPTGNAKAVDLVESRLPSISFFSKIRLGETDAAPSLFLLGRKGRPELIYFSDDFVANGGLMALLANGIDIPRDLGVVSLSNSGFLPVFTKSLSRFEVCPARDGETIAEAALDFLSGKKIQPIVNLTVSYIPGDSFPAENQR